MADCSTHVDVDTGPWCDETSTRYIDRCVSDATSRIRKLKAKSRSGTARFGNTEKGGAAEVQVRRKVVPIATDQMNKKGCSDDQMNKKRR